MKTHNFVSTIPNKPKFVHGIGFELLSNYEVNDSIYRVVNGNKVYPDNRKDYRTRSVQNVMAYDENGNKISVQLRYLRNSRYIEQNLQKEVEKINPNDKVSNLDRDDLYIRKGYIFPKTQLSFDFLWESPENEAYTDFRDTGTFAKYKLYQPDVAKKDFTNTVLLQRKALNYISKITDADNDFVKFDEEKVRSFHISLFGSYDEMPTNKYDLFNKLINVCDSNITDESEVIVLVNKLLSEEKEEPKRAGVKDVFTSPKEEFEPIEISKEDISKASVIVNVEDDLEQILGKAIQENVIKYKDSHKEVGLINQFKKHTNCFNNDQSGTKEDLHNLFKSYLLTKEGEKTLETIKNLIKWGVATTEDKTPPQT